MKSFKEFFQEEGIGSGAAGLQSTGGSPSVPGTTTSGGKDPIEKHIVKTAYGSLQHRQNKLRQKGVVVPESKNIIVPDVPVAPKTFMTKEEMDIEEGTVADQKVIRANNSKTDPDPTGFVQKFKPEIEDTKDIISKKTFSSLRTK